MCRGVGVALGDVSHEGQRTCNVDCRTVVVGGHLLDRTGDAVDALTLAPTGTFLLFAVMCVPYILIVWRLVPETKGLSLEEIEKITK